MQSAFVGLGDGALSGMGLEDAPLGSLGDQASNLVPSSQDVKAEQELKAAQAHLDKEEQDMSLAQLQQAYQRQKALFRAEQRRREHVQIWRQRQARRREQKHEAQQKRVDRQHALHALHDHGQLASWVMSHDKSVPAKGALSSGGIMGWLAPGKHGHDAVPPTSAAPDADSVMQVVQQKELRRERLVSSKIDEEDPARGRQVLCMTMICDDDDC